MTTTTCCCFFSVVIGDAGLQSMSSLNSEDWAVDGTKPLSGMGRSDGGTNNKTCLGYMECKNGTSLLSHTVRRDAKMA